MRKLVASSVLGLSVALAAGHAQAHFKLDAIEISPTDIKMPVSWMSQDSTGAPQKTGPCGNEGGGTKTSVVTDLKGAQTISVDVESTVAHKGWWRVALAEGPSSSQTVTTMPEQTFQSGAMCVPTIMTNPVWSTSQPIIADGLPQGSSTSTLQTGMLSLKVTIPPTASCTAAKPCSLQVMMIMTDHTAPSCYYHHCADIITSGASGNGSGGAGGGSGGAGGAKASGGSSGANGSGGVSASGGGNGSGGSNASGSTGGSSGSGGAPGSGGSASGGATSTGGALGSGGATSSGGKSSSGGVSGTGGSSSSSASGGASSPGADTSSSGCGVVSRGEAAFAPVAALLLVVLARRRRVR